MFGVGEVEAEKFVCLRKQEEAELYRLRPELQPVDARVQPVEQYEVTPSSL